MAKTALEALQHETPEGHVQGFLDGATVLRSLIENADLTDVMYPLRGAMPLSWALEGDNSLEAVPSYGRRHEVPLGVFTEYDNNGQGRRSSPNSPQKYEIIENTLVRVIDNDMRLGIIDEVQGGGTVIPLVSGVIQSLRRHNSQSLVKLFPAEDTRSVSINRRKTSGYRRMVSQQIMGLSTTVVRMPLVFCDRDVLLDEVIRTKSSIGGGYDYAVQRNVAAEKLFRFLGTASRNPDIAYDVTAVDELLATQSVTDSRAIDTAPAWIRRVVHRQSSK